MVTLQKAKSTFQASKQAWLENRTSTRTQMDLELMEARSQADQARSQSFEVMLAKQADKGHAVAAANYRDAVEAAVLVRRTAFDTARVEFRASVDIFFADYTNETEERIAKFEASSHDTFDNLTIICKRSRPELPVARSEFIDALKSARSEYNDFRQTRQDFTSAIKTLIETRNEAYKAAIRQFQQMMLQARETFNNAKANE